MKQVMFNGKSHYVSGWTIAWWATFWFIVAAGLGALYLDWRMCVG